MCVCVCVCVTHKSSLTATNVAVSKRGLFGKSSPESIETQKNVLSLCFFFLLEGGGESFAGGVRRGIGVFEGSNYRQTYQFRLIVSFGLCEVHFEGGKEGRRCQGICFQGSTKREGSLLVISLY